MGNNSDVVRDYRRLLKPLARAYVLGYLSSTTPQIFSLLAALSRKEIPYGVALLRLYTILRSAAAINRFPAFCGVLVGGSTLLKFPLRAFLTSSLTTLYRTHWRRGWQVDHVAIERLSRFLATLAAAIASFALLNSRQHSHLQGELAHAQVVVPGEDSKESKDRTTGPRRTSNLGSPPESFLPTLPDDRAEASTKPGTVTSSPTSISPFPSQPQDTTPLSLPPSALAGKTLDLTLFTTVHALSVLLTGVWPPPSRRTRLTNFISSATLPALFTFSCSTIMHAYFYAPFRLPHAYVSWISRFARLNPRLLRALREARFGNWRYGRDDGLGGLLSDMAEDLGLPRAWGDPAKTVPVPCQLVHQGMGKGCELNAGVRFVRAWVEAVKMYLPLRLGVVLLRWLLRLRRQRLYGRGMGPGARPATPAIPRLLIAALADAVRSSAFLAAFVSLFYYGVCLARTRLGPRIFSPKTVTPQMWDSGLCIHAGCLLCGLSLLVLPTEGNGISSRRADVVFFVLPRALGVWFPRRYERKYLWREGAVLAVGAAAVVTAAMERPEMVGGVLGRVLKGVFAE